ncbi:2,4'-dihydroxyacetophenone dioxygenase family protein [Pelomonas sp. SE-A7]|uniref:2,4'-dihydroxyacetophenone dioxygenase family protein n=1 Tax=Pelomonas sp. SE-A7 TaxID=3054953 RepID=UPI00259CDEE0|nr:2,4'-dihydroxyacetophenone dioxygenase family protein [Pelomonas sp. SE-A7]MDM4765038.1 2,4'-dihydroxyacetophenone dioxygenase family protein [Pelomonas sp. SE-A7]
MYYQQVQTAVVDDESLPWLVLSPQLPGVQLKYFRLDPVRGEVIALVRLAPGTRMPPHQQGGHAILYTVSGRWKFAEHDWIAGPGSVVFQTAGSRLSAEVLSEDEPTVVLAVAVGDRVLFDQQGGVMAIENWRTALQRYLDYCSLHCVTPRDLTASS